MTGDEQLQIAPWIATYIMIGSQVGSPEASVRMSCMRVM